MTCPSHLPRSGNPASPRKAAAYFALSPLLDGEREREREAGFQQLGTQKKRERKREKNELQEKRGGGGGSNKTTVLTAVAA